MSQDFPDTPVEPIIVDTICNAIALHLKTQLNDLSQQAHGWKLVNTIRDYDDNNIPLGDYPVLSVFRNDRGDYYSWESQEVKIPITIRYSVRIKKDSKQAIFLGRVGKYIHNYVSKVQNIYIDRSSPVIGRLQLVSRTNENVGNYIYMFSIIDSSVPESLQEYLI